MSYSTEKERKVKEAVWNECAKAAGSDISNVLFKNNPYKLKAKELEVQKLLRAGWTLQDLSDKYGIVHKFHGIYTNLVLLRYDQIDSPMGEKVVQECRGLILDTEDNYKVVAMPFTKFFNYGEAHAAQLDWSTARAYEKLDGSLITLYCYNGEWMVATSGTPDASGEVEGIDRKMTFAELFWDTYSKVVRGLNVTDLNPDYTYIFELCTPYNRIVVEYYSPKITFIGCRHNVTLEEESVDNVSYILKRIWPHYGFTIPCTFDLTSLTECIDFVNGANPLEEEGVVIVDANWNRLKIKNPGWIALHHIKSSSGIKKLADVIRKGESPEFTLAVGKLGGEVLSKFNQLEARHIGLALKVQGEYEKIKGVQDQKEFALEATKFSFSGLLFNMRKTKCTAAQALANPKLSTDNYLELLEKEDNVSAS
jgi:T4 RnlA family RNA ligase